jgi:ribosome biogenesis GTPase
MRPEQYSEDDAKIRPARRNKRPRSKERPAHTNAKPGLVTAVDRGRYTVYLGQDLPDVPLWATASSDQTPVVAVRARELGRGSILVGDVVSLVGDVSGNPGSLARVVRVAPRATTLTRTIDDQLDAERAVVANAGVLGIVTATTDPEPRTGFLDRCVMAAFSGGLRPLLILTKSDLALNPDLAAHYDALGVIVVRAGTDDDLTELLSYLDSNLSVLIGQSGVGKSTLVNNLTDSIRRIGEVNEVTGQGRHTSTSAVALPLPGPGWVVDTPGIRSFGLAHVDLDRVFQSFPELEPGTADCPRGCTHLPPDCALDVWITAGGGGPGAGETLTSVRRVIRSRETSG